MKIWTSPIWSASSALLVRDKNRWVPIDRFVRTISMEHGASLRLGGESGDSDLNEACVKFEYIHRGGLAST